MVIDWKSTILFFLLSCMVTNTYAELEVSSERSKRSMRLFLANQKVHKVFFPKEGKPFDTILANELKLVGCSLESKKSFDWASYRQKNLLNEFPINWSDENGVSCKILSGRLSLNPFAIPREGDPTNKIIKTKFRSNHRLKQWVCMSAPAGFTKFALSRLGDAKDIFKNQITLGLFGLSVFTDLVMPAFFCVVNTVSSSENLVKSESYIHLKLLRKYAFETILQSNALMDTDWRPGLELSTEWNNIKSHNQLHDSIVHEFNTHTSEHSLLSGNLIDHPLMQTLPEKLLHWSTIVAKKFDRSYLHPFERSIQYSEINLIFEKRCNIQELRAEKNMSTAAFCQKLFELSLNEQIELINKREQEYTIELEQLAAIRQKEPSILMCEAPKLKQCLKDQISPNGSLDTSHDASSSLIESALITCEKHCKIPNKEQFHLKPKTIFCGQYTLQTCLTQKPIATCVKSSCFEKTTPLMYDPILR